MKRILVGVGASYGLALAFILPVIASTIPLLGVGKAPSCVVPAVTTFNSGSGTFDVPCYNTLIVEVWGGGASGATRTASAVCTASGNNTGDNGSASSVSTLSLTANGGSGSVATSTGGTGGTASGGDVNTTGGNGGNYNNAGSPSGVGGNSPNGGNGGASVGPAPNGNFVNGLAGNAPGGGGSGGARRDDGLAINCGASGGGAGGYTKKTFTFGAGGAPLVGDDLSYSVGAGAAERCSTFGCSGAGANGRVRFEVQ